MKKPRCVACYEPVESDHEHLLICPAGVVCGRCTRIARGAPYWIYVSGLHPVVVQAKDLREAVEKLKRNPKYDRIGTEMLLVSDFEKSCRSSP